MTALGLLSESMLRAERPLTSFIEKPDGSEALCSAVQLVINLSAIAVAGTLTVLVLRARAVQLARRTPARTA